MEHFSFSPEPPSVRKTPPAGEVARKCQKGNGWHRAAMTEGVSFCHTAKNLCKNAVFRLLFVWADSILDVYAFFLLRRVFPFRSFLSLIAARCSDDIQKYLGITLLPQAGVALGMAATAAQLSDGHMVRNVVLFSVPVYELSGPTLTKIALTAAGAIRPEGRTSARVENKPEEVA